MGLQTIWLGSQRHNFKRWNVTNCNRSVFPSTFIIDVAFILAIFQMVGHRPTSYDDTPQARVDRIFALMDDVSICWNCSSIHKKSSRMETESWARKSSSTALAKTVQLLELYQCTKAQFNFVITVFYTPNTNSLKSKIIKLLYESRNRHEDVIIEISSHVMSKWRQWHFSWHQITSALSLKVQFYSVCQIDAQLGQIQG